MPRKRQRLEGEADDDDGHDVHRISSEHLQQLYEEAKKDPLDELLFMLMLTTGLRVGGVTKVLTRNVAEVKNGMLVVGQAGKTKEKGNKFARFVLCEQVRELMHAWLNQHRPADPGPYVFPGIAQGGHMSTEGIRGRFHRLCQRCGLEGREFHPHALRHTHAHILLECGNTVEAVSKCLNHSSTVVTQQVYLRESAAEVQARCITPWAPPETAGEKQERALSALPGFLRHSAAGGNSSSAAADDRKRQRKEKNRAMLREFNAA